MKIEARQSGIHGMGVFAIADIAKGELVVPWGGAKILTREEADNVEVGLQCYVSCFKGVWRLMPEPARYVNHSCEPNTAVSDAGDVALRDIQIGEEITSDYANDSEAGFEMKCTCGLPTCKGVIKG